MQRLVGQFDDLDDALRGDPADRLAQRDVGADVRDREVAGGQHHREALHATCRGDQLGVADETWIAELRRLFVHRHRHDAGDPPGQRVVGRGNDVLASGGARAASITPGR